MSRLDLNSAPDAYAVMGNPIAHSKSPQIHSRFAGQTGQRLTYSAILVEPGRLEQAVGDFLASGGKGLNITVPFKQDAWRLVDERTPRAELAGAVNTIAIRPDGTLLGDNTDGIGLVRDIRDNHGIGLVGRRLLVLGAGGAVRGVLGPMLAEGPAEVVIANRTVGRALALAEHFATVGPVRGCGYDALAGEPFDLIINGTSASLKGELPPLPSSVLKANSWCYDMMYAAEPTAFVRWARERGAQAVDGLGMLVEQAAESFLLWRGVRPETGAVIAELRAALEGGRA